MSKAECIMCRGAEADGELDRIEAWQDAHWRLTVSLASEVLGFAYLESKRHITHIHELDGDEALTFGSALSRCTKALKGATNADVVYVYIFGDGVPHLHVHLAPHRPGDALNDQMIRGEIVEEKLPSGMTRFYSPEFPALPRDKHTETANRVRKSWVEASCAGASHNEQSAPYLGEVNGPLSVHSNRTGDWGTVAARYLPLQRDDRCSGRFSRQRQTPSAGGRGESDVPLFAVSAGGRQG